MRIFVVGRWVETFPFSESWGHAYRYYGEVAAVPFPWYGTAPTPREAFEEIIKIYQPKLLHVDGTYLGEKDLSFDFLKKLRSKGTRLIGRPVEPSLGKEWNLWLELSPLMDFVYTASPILIEEARKVGIENWRFLSAATDPEFYYPLDVEKTIDTLFLGHPEEGRAQKLQQLDKEFDLWVGGGVHLNLGLKHHFWGAFGRALNEWNAKTRIGLCLKRETTKRLDIPFTFSLVNTLATKTFALVEYVAGLEKFFERKVHLDWFETSEEMVELARYWLSQNDLRDKVAEQGYEFVLKNHTFRHSVERIMRDLRLIV